MNPSTLVLQPSGHSDITSSPSANAVAANRGNSDDDGSSFAGALKAASPKPARKSPNSKAADDPQSGGDLPANGNAPPPTPVAAAHAGMHAPAAANNTSSKSSDTAGTSAAVGAATGSAATTGVPASTAGGAAVGAAGAQPASGPATGSDAAKTAGGVGSSPPAAADGAASAAAAAASAADSANAFAASAADAAAKAAESAAAPPAPTVASAATDAPDTAAVPMAVSGAAPGPTNPAGRTSAKPAVAALRSTTTNATQSTDASASGSATDPKSLADAAALQAAAPTNTASTGDTSGGDPSAVSAAAAGSLAANVPAAGAANSNNTDPAAAAGLQAVAAATEIGASAQALAAASHAALAATKADDATISGLKDKVSSAVADVAPGPGGADAAAGLSQLTSSAVPASADTVATPTLRVHASVDSTEFAQGLSDRVSWMVGNSLNGAKLQVNPPQLGPIELRIAVNGAHAQVWMTTHSAVTRDALEASSPKLHEMLNAQGFGQVSVDISQRSFQDRSAYSQPYERTPAAERSTAAAGSVSAVSAATPRASPGGLDAYA